MDSTLIGLDEVSKIFGKTINQMRNYKSMGIIEPSTKNGNKELYSKMDVENAKKLLDQNIIKMNLRQIGMLITQKREGKLNEREAL